MALSVLLTNPKSANAFESFGFIFPPLGLLYIAATAEQAGHRIAIEDFCVSGHTPDQVDFSLYDVVGITSDTRRFPGALRIARRAKAAGCIVVMGGPHPGFADEDILRQNQADYVIRGEGEIPFPCLLNALEQRGDLSAVPGISYLQNGVVTRTAPSALIENLDSLPFPARHCVDMELYKRKGLKYGGKRPVAVLSSSRGCPHQCSFCVTPQMYGNRWRARSAASVVAEMEHVYHTYGYRAFAFCDDNFTVSPKRVMEVCDLILEKKLDVWWWCLSTPATLLRNEDMVRMMASAGVKTVYLGVESANLSTLKDFNKSLKQDEPYQAVELLRKNGIEAFTSFILGGVHDDLSATLNTIRFARTLDAAVAQFTILTPYPGTAFFAEVEPLLRHRKWHLYDGVHLVFRHQHIPFVLMELLLLWAYARFYARGWRAIRNFFRALRNNNPMLKKIRGDVS